VVCSGNLLNPEPDPLFKILRGKDRGIAAKGFETADATLRAAVRDQLLTVLRTARKRETVEQIGMGRGVQWKLA